MRKALVFSLSLVMFCTACSTAWVSTLDSILAAAAPALIDILQIVAVANGGMLDTNLAAKINRDSAAMKTLAADFSKASAAAAPGACSQLQAGIGVFSADIALVTSTAQVKDQKTQTKIVLLTSLVAGTAQAIMAVIPSCQVPVQGFKMAPPYSLATFVQHYNSILVAKTGNAGVDAVTSKMKLHQHSKLVRYATVGLLN